MPRRNKGPRLHWRAGRGVWEIRDAGDLRISTGFGRGQEAEAEAALEVYLASKRLKSGPVPPEELTVGQVLALYADEKAVGFAAPDRVGYAIDALAGFWGNDAVSEVKASRCREYVTWRGVSASTVRRELGVLQAALRHCARESYLTAAPEVWRPQESPPVDRWLTRQEVAWLLRAARQLRKDGRHLADFILCGVYTGSRKATILGLQIDQPSVTGGYIDTRQGVLYRRPADKRETKKRQRPARLPAKYLAHVQRQARRGRRFVVQDDAGNRVGDIRKGWVRAVELAAELAAKKEIELDLTQITGGARKPITPHVLKHTSITWALQRGAEIWDAAGLFSTSAETIERVYGHHSPKHQESAVRALNRK
ncbi:tyrosine-type recombinase/integrase [Seohaeicola nanhaiensis]|uniref:Tyrosine-type recombinase/integrase n=1 Tax=Seohaeicola nanhaiensis TaxID=1387282 RepID=A0ABV9KEL3_9RHOB